MGADYSDCIALLSALVTNKMNSGRLFHDGVVVIKDMICKVSNNDTPRDMIDTL